MRSFYTAPSSQTHPDSSPRTPQPAAMSEGCSPVWSGPRSTNSNRRLSAKGTRQNLATCAVFLQAGLSKHQQRASAVRSAPQGAAPGMTQDGLRSPAATRASKSGHKGDARSRSGLQRRRSEQPAARRSSRRHSSSDPGTPASSTLEPSLPAPDVCQQPGLPSHTQQGVPSCQDIIQDTTHSSKGDCAGTVDGQLWVQCEMCNKWRLMPAEHQASFTPL